MATTMGVVTVRGDDKGSKPVTSVTQCDTILVIGLSVTHDKKNKNSLS